MKLHTAQLLYALLLSGALSLALQPSTLAAHTDVVLRYAGSLEEGKAYRAGVICDKEDGLKLLVPLRVALHQAARIEWDNLAQYPELTEQPARGCRRQIVFRVTSKQTAKVYGQNRWNVTYHCQIIRMQSSKKKKH